MKRHILITVIWVIYLVAAVIFLINALSGMTGYVILEGTSAGISAAFTFIFIAATVLLILYNRKLRE